MASSVQFQKPAQPELAKHDSSVLDLAFAMDTTSSMGSYIKQAQQSIRQIVEEIVASEASDVNLALVEYRDHPPQDSTYVTQVHDFTQSVKKMKQWLDSSRAVGGGDTPEAVADALHDVLKLSWREKATKICVLISDAPPHGLLPSGDGFPKGCPAGIDPVDIVNQLAAKGVILYVVGCEPSINPSREFFTAIAFITGGQYVPLTNAKLLAKVIIGGAEEELSLDHLMAQVEEEIDQRVQDGEEMDEDALTVGIQERFKSMGVKSKQLHKGSAPLPLASGFAKKLSAMTNMSDVADCYAAEAPPPPPMAGMPMMMKFKKPSKRTGALPPFHVGGRPMLEVDCEEECGDCEEGDEMIMPMGAATSMEACVDDSYETREDFVNMHQSNRMVQRAKKKKVPTATLR